LLARIGFAEAETVLEQLPTNPTPFSFH